MYAGTSVARKIPLVGIGWVGKAERKEAGPFGVAKDKAHTLRTII